MHICFVTSCFQILENMVTDFYLQMTFDQEIKMVVTHESNMVNVTFNVLFIIHFLANYKRYWIGFSVMCLNVKHVCCISLYLIH